MKGKRSAVRLAMNFAANGQFEYLPKALENIHRINERLPLDFILSGDSKKVFHFYIKNTCSSLMIMPVLKFSTTGIATEDVPFESETDNYI